MGWGAAGERALSLSLPAFSFFFLIPHQQLRRQRQRRPGQAGPIHQRNRRRPVAVAVEERGNRAPIDDAGEGLVLGRQPGAGLQAAAGGAEGGQAQAVGRGGPAAKALGFRGVGLLDGQLGAGVVDADRALDDRGVEPRAGGRERKEGCGRVDESGRGGPFFLCRTG